MIDYHVHTKFSGDSQAEPEQQLLAASARGIEEICFTDHVDFDNPGQNFPPADLAARGRLLASFGGDYKGVRIKSGAEISLATLSGCNEKTEAYLAPHELDFIIGSVHCVDRVDVYYPEYHRGKTKKDAYLAYLETILASLDDFRFISVLGHYDFVAKYAPYDDRSMRLDLSTEIYAAFEEIFKRIVKNGKGIEINTAAWRDDPAWGLDILKLYRELGGEFVTFASDAHTPQKLGNRLQQAKQLALAAGIGYYATFDRLEPTLWPVEKA